MFLEIKIDYGDLDGIITTKIPSKPRVNIAIRFWEMEFQVGLVEVLRWGNCADV